MTEANKYILYCAQECNFQTRSMLIPYDKIMQCPGRVKDLETLRQFSMKNISFKRGEKEYIVDQLLLENITTHNGGGIIETTPFTNIINDFTLYADGNHQDVDENDNPTYVTYEPGDEIWSEHVICHITKGFDHIKNYCEFRNRKEYQDKPIEITEGFLVLETENGTIRCH